jgi:hypothetical protein
MVYLADEVRELHAQGLTQKQISGRLGCGLNTVRRRMKELGLQGKSKGSRDFKIKSDVFDNISTEEKAYWLGFFLADACIAKSAGTRRAFRLGLKKQDEKHVRKAAKFLGYKGKLHPDNRDNHPRVVMVFNDVPLCKKLMDKGWWEYKRGRDFSIINIVPDKLFHHFVRGYYDGDGSITYRRRKRKNGSKGPQKRWYCNITCKDRAALEVIGCKIVENGGPDSEVKRRSKAFDLRWANKERTSLILDWMYKDATIFLERKMSRRHEFEGLVPFVFNNVSDFSFSIRSSDLIARKDKDEIVSAFTAEVLASDWRPPKYDANHDLRQTNDLPDLLIDGKIHAKSAAGNKFIGQYQPMIWYVKQNSGPALASFASHPSTVRRAIKNFCNTPDRNLSPQRFIRELRFAGFSVASLLAAPVIIAAIKHFDLSGKWFDPCAGWGNRLLASHILGLEYEATDPGVSYPGLLNIRNNLGSSAILHNQKWQDLGWPSCDFILTSPPFHNKEDYLDNVEYGKFEDWYCSFLKPLATKCVNTAMTVLHVDKPMRDALIKDFQINELPIVSGSRHKAPKEWFVLMK